MNIIIWLLIVGLAYWVFAIKKTVLKRKNRPYLIRWTIISTKWFTIKVHKVLISDEVHPHNHPWNYTSIILWGGYWEESTELLAKINFSTGEETRTKEVTRRWYSPLSILRRRAGTFHRLILNPGTISYSIIFTSKKKYNWGILEGLEFKSFANQPYL